MRWEKGACLKRRVGRRAALDNRDLGRDSGRDERDGPGGIIRLVLAPGTVVWWETVLMI